MKEPSIKETAFDCPHCGAFTTQYWHNCFVQYIKGDEKVPFIPTEQQLDNVLNRNNVDNKEKEVYKNFFYKMKLKLLFPTEHESPKYLKDEINNLFLSKCYNCDKWAIWVNEDLVYPTKKFGELPNQDLPPSVLMVVDEARTIINDSPKGAAALLRLAIQMLCKHLGKTGKDLNSDIAELVRDGLKPTVQKALDVVRVIGNESVHPGQIDLNDDKDIAMQLFDLVNIISEQMITIPNKVENLYSKLPEDKLIAIDKRDSSNNNNNDF